MNEIPIYQVDAFTDRLFGGNPAAICPLKEWLPDGMLQAIALENNLSETAFFARERDRLRLRWFTPKTEVDLCGHATLATAWLIFNKLGRESEEVAFETRSGRLTVERNGDLLTMDFPSAEPNHVDAVPDEFVAALGSEPIEVLVGGDFLMAVFADSDTVRLMQPDFMGLLKMQQHAVIVTAAAKASDAMPGLPKPDFVSRMFAPKVGIPEDPVTGSAHCVLTPYWTEKLKKRILVGHQISARGGVVHCEDRGARVGLSGTARLYMTGALHLGTK